MYIESIKSRFRIIGYGLIGLSFIYFSLEPVFSQVVPELLYNNAASNRILSYFFFLFYLLLLMGATLINYVVNSKSALMVVTTTLVLGLPYPIQSIYNLSHPNNQPTYIFYDLFAVSIILSLTYSLINERKLYKFVGILLLMEWFFFDYWISMSGQYIFLGLSNMLTDMVAVLMVIYCILEVVLERTFTKVAL